MFIMLVNTWCYFNDTLWLQVKYFAYSCKYVVRRSHLRLICIWWVNTWCHFSTRLYVKYEIFSFNSVHVPEVQGSHLRLTFTRWYDILLFEWWIIMNNEYSNVNEIYSGQQSNSMYGESGNSGKGCHTALLCDVTSLRALHFIGNEATGPVCCYVPWYTYCTWHSHLTVDCNGTSVGQMLGNSFPTWFIPNALVRWRNKQQ